MVKYLGTGEGGPGPTSTTSQSQRHVPQTREERDSKKRRKETDEPGEEGHSDSNVEATSRVTCRRELAKYLLKEEGPFP